LDKTTSKEIENPDLLAPCGLYCGVCGVYIATRDNNPKFKVILSQLYGSTPEKTECKGCMQSELLFEYCSTCPIRDCVKKKEFYSCYQCQDFPCKFQKRFAFPVGRKVMLRAIPEWRECCSKYGREKGNIEFAQSQINRYKCPTCGAPLFRGAKRCRECKSPTEVD
jgi:hypothetical protein